MQINPQCLIVATSDAAGVARRIASLPGLQALSAVQQARVFFVDEATQECPSQYVALAYYDIADSLIKAARSLAEEAS